MDSILRPVLQPVLQPVLRSVFCAASGGASPTNPVQALFANGEQGAWYDPSDFSTMFQDAACTVPVTAAGDPVGRILDKSGNGNHATQASAASKPILQESGGLYYLQFDGIDDSLSTGSIDFTSTDKMTAVAGVRKLSDAAGMVVELSANYNNYAGSAYIIAGLDFSNGYRATSRGTAVANAAQSSAYLVIAPNTSVLSATHDIPGDSTIMRANGVAQAAGTGDKGNGNFGNYPLYIGRRGGTSLHLNGHIYQLIVRGALTTDLEPVETFVNSKTGAY